MFNAAQLTTEENSWWDLIAKDKLAPEFLH